VASVFAQHVRRLRQACLRTRLKCDLKIMLFGSGSVCRGLFYIDWEIFQDPNLFALLDRKDSVDSFETVEKNINFSARHHPSFSLVRPSKG